MDGLNWRKASYSGSGGGNCVEVAGAASVILVRDTQDRAGALLAFTPRAWQDFAARVRDDRAA
jgi:hypothetical protein